MTMNLPRSQYPTPKEIMESPVDFRKDTINAVLEWKKEFFDGTWKTKNTETRLSFLETLVYKLNSVYKINPSVDTYNSHYAYDPTRNIIRFDNRHASIISTLHEFRHALNGPDERSACRWSIHLFKTCFPEHFEKLMFKPGSHLLIKKE